MARRDEMVQRVDERDLSPATQGADLSAVEGRPEGHWRDQAQQREASAPSDDAPPAEFAPASEAPVVSAPGDISRSDAASDDAEQTTSSSQAMGAEAGQTLDLELDPRVGVEMQWEGPNGAAHSRSVEVGANLNSSHTVEAAADIAAAQHQTVASLPSGLNNIEPLDDGGPMGAVPPALDGVVDQLEASLDGAITPLEASLSVIEQDIVTVTDLADDQVSSVIETVDGEVGDLNQTLSDTLDTATSLGTVGNASDLLQDLAPTSNGGMLSTIFQPGDEPIDQTFADSLISDDALDDLSGELDVVDTALGGESGLLGQDDGDSGLLGGDLIDDNPLGL